MLISIIVLDFSVLQDHSARTWTTLSFWLVEGLSERGSLSTDAWPSLKQLYHPVCARYSWNLPENLLHLTNGYRSRIFKLLAKCNAISLFKFFNNFTKIKIGRQRLRSLASDRRFLQTWKNKVRYFLNTLSILGQHFYKSAKAELPYDCIFIETIDAARRFK